MKDRLKKIRTELGYTQQDFADRLGVRKNTISQWESGINQMSSMTVTAICREFGVNREYLEDGKEPMFTDRCKDSLSMLAESYRLGTEDLAVIRSYAELPPKKREAVRQFMQGAVAPSMEDAAYLKTSDIAASGD